MKTYKYVIELKEEMWPRSIADKMSMLPLFADILLSVQDLQRADHMYGNNNTTESDTFTLKSDVFTIEKEGDNDNR